MTAISNLEKIKQIEAEIKSILGDDPLNCDDIRDRDVIDRIHDLLCDRRQILDNIFTFSPDEMKRLEEVNEVLRRENKKMYYRILSLYRLMLAQGRDLDFDDDFGCEGKLTVGGDYDPVLEDNESVLKLDNDSYYGSDFAYMICVTKYLPNHMHDIDNCWIDYSPEHTLDTPTEALISTDFEINDDINHDDSHCKHFQHMKFCYAFHSLFDHLKYPLADIVRMKRFDVEVTTTCQRFTSF